MTRVVPRKNSWSPCLQRSFITRTWTTQNATFRFGFVTTTANFTQSISKRFGLLHKQGWLELHALEDRGQQQSYSGERVEPEKKLPHPRRTHQSEQAGEQNETKFNFSAGQWSRSLAVTLAPRLHKNTFAEYLGDHGTRNSDLASFLATLPEGKTSFLRSELACLKINKCKARDTMSNNCELAACMCHWKDQRFVFSFSNRFFWLGRHGQTLMEETLEQADVSTFSQSQVRQKYERDCILVLTLSCWSCCLHNCNCNVWFAEGEGQPFWPQVPRRWETSGLRCPQLCGRDQEANFFWIVLLCSYVMSLGNLNAFVFWSAAGLRFLSEWTTTCSEGGLRFSQRRDVYLISCSFTRHQWLADQVDTTFNKILPCGKFDGNDFQWNKRKVMKIFSRKFYTFVRVTRKAKQMSWETCEHSWTGREHRTGSHSWIDHSLSQGTSKEQNTYKRVAVEIAFGTLLNLHFACQCATKMTQTVCYACAKEKWHVPVVKPQSSPEFLFLISHTTARHAHEEAVAKSTGVARQTFEHLIGQKNRQ